MQYAGRIVQEPSFHILVRNVMRRLSSLYYFHCGEQWKADYKGLVERAKRVEIAETDLKWEDWERYSERRSRRIKMGGLMGRVWYTGMIAEFRPLLMVGSLVHVGKQTVFGNGQFAVA